MLHRRVQHGKSLLDIVRRLERVMAGQRTDVQATVGAQAHEIQAGDPVDVDQDAGIEQAEVQHRDKTLAARDDLGVALCRLQCPDRIVQGVGAQIIEFWRLHGRVTCR